MREWKGLMSKGNDTRKLYIKATGKKSYGLYIDDRLIDNAFITLKQVAKHTFFYERVGFVLDLPSDIMKKINKYRCFYEGEMGIEARPKKR